MDVDKLDLPSGWQVKAIQDVYKFTKKPSRLKLESYEQIPFIPMNLVPLGRIFTEDWNWKNTEDLGSGTYFENGDLLVAKITPSFENGKQAIGKIESPFGYATTEVIPIQEIEGVSNKFYLHFVLLHPEIRKELAGKMDGSTGRQRLRKEILASKRIPFPPLLEQRRIAHVLTAVQTAIEQQARMISLTRELKSALMKKLFTEGLRGEKPKETEIGLVPDGWDVLPLDELLTRTQYGLSVRGEQTGNYGILRMTNQIEGKISTDKMQYVNISEKDFEKYRLQQGDVLFNRTNSLELVGRTAIFDIDGDFVFASYLIRVNADEEQLNPFFLNHYFNWDETQKRLKSIALRAVSQSNISATRLRTFQVPVPSLEEQDEIIANIDLINAKIEFHHKKKTLLEELSRTLLHQLMTGEVRTTDLHGLLDDTDDRSAQSDSSAVQTKG